MGASYQMRSKPGRDAAVRAIGRKEAGSVDRQRCSSRVRERQRCSSSAWVTPMGERWLAGRAYHSGLRASPEEMKLAILPRSQWISLERVSSSTSAAV